MFMGFSVNEAVAIRADDVDLDYAMQVTYVTPDGRVLKGDVPAEAARDLRMAKELTTLRYNTNRYRREVPRAEGNQILRGMRELTFETEEARNAYIANTIRTHISRVFRHTREQLEKTTGIPDWCSDELTFDSAMRSGAFCFYYERERAGLDVDVENIYQLRFYKQVGRDLVYRGLRNMYLPQYSLWKDAFT